MAAGATPGVLWLALQAGPVLSETESSPATESEAAQELQLRGTIGDRHRRSDPPTREPRLADNEQGDSEDVIGEMSGKTPSDLGDAVNQGNRSTVSTSNSDLTRFGDSCSDDR